MKKFRETMLTGAKIAAVLAAVWFCIAESAEARDAVSEAIGRCLSVVIPSLYAMMIVSGLLVKSGTLACISGYSQKLGWTAVFLLSQVAGYPVGTRILCAEVSAGHINRRRAELLAGACCGAGPAFIFGCISAQLYGSDSAGILIFLSSIAANAVIAVAALLLCGNEKMCTQMRVRPRFSADLITEAVVGGGRAMAEICFMIIGFSVLTAILRNFGAISAAAEAVSALTGLPKPISGQIVCAFLDVTAVNGLPVGNYALLPCLTSLVSFGGVCVLMQIAALVRGGLSLRPLILSRIAAGVISYAICRAAMPIFLRNTAIYTSSINAVSHKAASPVPSMLLIMMTVLLMSEYMKSGKKS